MGLVEYFKSKFSRRKARRVFDEYPTVVNDFHLPVEGKVQFANWENPLMKPKTITQAEVNFFKKFIPKGSMAIDIGTNIGDTTVPMALAAGKEGVTLGFDPKPHVFRVLEANATLNKEKTNIVPLPYAITDKPGEFYYSSSEASFSNGGITTEPSKFHGAYSLPTKIKGIVLEDYLNEQLPHWLTKLSFIKIDAEGFDKQIIISIHSLIEKYKPIVVSECFTKMSKPERDELYDSIASKGYDLFFFEDFDENAAIIPLTKNDMMRWKNFNFYGVPKKA
ncbi:MAG TPA: FkbM family methyltransferase [Flavitalea sp.]|nr:FkbM family methyltransferase [Flavitalea sp.]